MAAWHRLFHLERGKNAEALAESYLKTQGLRVLATNYRCRFGEIDLICQDKDAVVFVEVRFRKPGGFGDGAESVDHHKRRKLIRTARHYLLTTGDVEAFDCRFDVVSLDSLNSESIDWIPNAFDATGFE